MKILALSFLLLIGVVLVADGMGQHISKGYIYFAMAFSLGVELINMRLRARQRPVQLRTKMGALETSRPRTSRLRRGAERTRDLRGRAGEAAETGALGASTGRACKQFAQRWSPRVDGESGRSQK